MARKPAQPRAIRTRKKLMTALETLLRQQEFEDIAIADIAREAGVAVGSVYSHFRDKHAFLEALLDERQALLAERVQQARAARAGLARFGSLRAALAAAVRSALEQVRTDAHIIRALHTHARLKGEDAGGRHQELANAAFETVRALLDAYGGEVERADREEAARVVNYVLNVVFLEKALFPRAPLLAGVTPPDDVLIEAATDMLYGYLTASAGRAGI